MAKKIIRITESDLHRIVKESVKEILREDEWDAYLQQDDDIPDGYYYDDDANEWVYDANRLNQPNGFVETIDYMPTN